MLRGEGSSSPVEALQPPVRNPSRVNQWEQQYVVPAGEAGRRNETAGYIAPGGRQEVRVGRGGGVFLRASVQEGDIREPRPVETRVVVDGHSVWRQTGEDIFSHQWLEEREDGQRKLVVDYGKRGKLLITASGDGNVRIKVENEVHATNGSRGAEVEYVPLDQRAMTAWRRLQKRVDNSVK